MQPSTTIDLNQAETRIIAVAPYPHIFPTVLASSALDACTATFEVLSYCVDRKDGHLAAALTAASDTIDMYVQLVENLDVADPMFESKIAGHPLMRQEVEVRNRIEVYLNSIDELKFSDVDKLEILQFNKGLGNLNLL